MKSQVDEDDDQTPEEWLQEQLANAEAPTDAPNDYKKKHAVSFVVSLAALIASFLVLALVRRDMMAERGTDISRIPGLFEIALALNVAVGLFSLFSIAVTRRCGDAEDMPEFAKPPYVHRIMALAAVIISALAAMQILNVLIYSLQLLHEQT